VVNGVIVVVKVLVLVLFVAVGALYVNPANWHPFIPENTGAFGSFGWSGVLRGAGVIFFAYIGFDAVSTAAQEARRPQRDMPIGILASLAICTALFIAVSLVVTGLVHYGKLNVPNPIAVAIEASGVRWLSPFVSVGALAGISSVMIVVLLGQSRIFYSMSRDGFLPPVFRNVHPRFKTPYLSTMLTGIIVAVGAGATPIAVLSQLTSMGTLLAFVIVSLSVIVLRRTEPTLPRPFRTPWVPWVPLLAAVICFAQMAALPWPTWERLIIWLVIGGIIYLGYGRRAEQRVGLDRARADAA
jgi:APA family basic amino acid/polyamine antiporter